MLTTEIVNLDHTKIDSETHKLKTNMKRMFMSMIINVLDHVKKLLKTMLVEMLRLDVPVCPLKVRRRFHAVSYTHLTLPTTPYV